MPGALFTGLGVEEVLITNFFSTPPGLWVSHGAAALASLASRAVAPLQAKRVTVGYPWQAAVNESCGLVDRSDRQTRRATAVSWLVVHLRLIPGRNT